MAAPESAVAALPITIIPDVPSGYCRPGASPVWGYAGGATASARRDRQRARSAGSVGKGQIHTGATGRRVAACPRALDAIRPSYISRPAPKFGAAHYVTQGQHSPRLE